MGQHEVPDEVILQRASQSAERLLEHLRRNNAGQQDEGTGVASESAGPTDALQAAITSLSSLVTAMHKESQRR